MYVYKNSQNPFFFFFLFLNTFFIFFSCSSTINRICLFFKNYTNPNWNHLWLVIFFSCLLSSMLEKNLRQLIECVDDVAADTNKYLTFQKLYQRQQQSKQQHIHKRVRYIFLSYCTCLSFTKIQNLL